MSYQVHPLDHPGTIWLIALVAFVLTTTLLGGFVAAALRLSA
jgi:hypothetical protein